MDASVMPAYVEPVRRSIVVKVGQARAFEVFTARMDRWWLRTHSIGKSPIAEVVMEQRVGGRWYERGEDGSECEWGHVLVWEPPRRVVLAWQIDAQFKYNPEMVTEVEVRFEPRGAKETEVLLEHRLIERLGDAAAGFAKGVGGGWGGLLEVFGKEAAQG